MQNELLNFNTRIVLTSSNRTGSTLLANILLGMFCNYDSLKFIENPLDETNRFVFNNNFIIKTHSPMFEEITKKFREYNMYYVESTRFMDDTKVFKAYPLFNSSKHLQIDYNEFVETETLDLKTAIFNVAEKLSSFLPKEIVCFIDKNAAYDRIKKMNHFYETTLKDKGWGPEVDPVYGLHGHHRNRFWVK